METHDLVETELIGSHELVLFCRSGHPLANKPLITNDDLASFSLVMTRLPARGTESLLANRYSVPILEQVLSDDADKEFDGACVQYVDEKCANQRHDQERFGRGPILLGYGVHVGNGDGSRT